MEHTSQAIKVLAVAAVILAFALTQGCGPSVIRQAPGNPAGCSVTKSGSIATITCPDGTTATVSDGATGTGGQNGIDGASGHSAISSQAPAADDLCANGGVAISLGVDLDDSSTLELSEVQQVIVICNGTNGADGSDGNSGNGNSGNAPGHNK